MKVIRTSPFNGKVNEMDLNITQEQLDRWNRGEMVQNVFPHLTPSEREFLMTGITDDEWPGGEEEEDDEDLEDDGLE